MNGLDIQTTGDSSLMRIKGDGTVGIGTVNPTAQIANTGLRVANSGHVTVDNNYGFFSVNNAGDGIGAGVDTTSTDELALYAGGSSRVHVGAASSGDDSVQMPADSVSAGERLNEPGLARRWRTDNIDVTTNSEMVLVARTITCPSDGYVLAFGSVFVRGQNPCF